MASIYLLIFSCTNWWEKFAFFSHFCLHWFAAAAVVMGWSISTSISVLPISTGFFKKLSFPESLSPQLPSMETSKFFSSKRINIKSSRILAASQLNVEDEACELVSGAELSIGDGDDEINAYLCQAVKNNNGAGILLLSDVFGFQDSATRDFAYRVACNGYNVLVPDLFRGDPWGKERPKSLYEEWRARQDAERVAKDAFASANWMLKEFLAAGISNKLGIVGFCFGGGRVIDILAQDQGRCFGVGVSFYGTRFNTSVATNVKVPVLLIAGDNDPLCPILGLKDIGKEIEQSKVVVFEGRGHGFVHRPESPEEDEDAEKAFVLMRNWLHQGLDIES